MRQAIARTPDGHPHRVAYLGDLGVILLGAVRRFRRLEDIDEAIGALRHAVASPMIGAAIRTTYLEALTIALIQRFDQIGDVAAIDEALGVIEVVVRQTPDDHRARATRLTRQADLLRRRSVRFGSATDLDAAIRINRAAVMAAAPGSLEGHRLARRLASTLLDRFAQRGELADLHEAVALARTSATALTERSDDAAARIAAQITLADALRASAISSDAGLSVEPGGAGGVLDEAEAVVRAAVGSSQSPPAAAFTTLSRILLVKAEQRGDHAALHGAVDAARHAAEANPSAEMHMRLGIALRHRYDVLGDAGDLQAAIEASRRALGALPADHGELDMHLSNLSELLIRYGERTGDLQSLDEAVEMQRQAVTATEGRPRHATSLAGLSDALQARFESVDDPDRTDLDEAIGCRRAALTATDTNDARSRYDRFALANALQIRHEQHEQLLDEGDMAAADHADHEDLIEAIELLKECLRMSPSPDSFRPIVQYTLGLALYARHHSAMKAKGTTDLVAALELWRQAVASPAGPVRPLPVAVLAKVELARGTAELDGPAAAVDLYAEATEHWAAHIWRGSRLEDHQARTPAKLATIGSEAAACAIAAGRPAQAVEPLERGRSILWQLILDNRTDLTSLSRADPTLAGALIRIRTALDSASGEARMHAARRFDELVAEVRALPPSDDLPEPAAFMQRPTLDRLRSAATNGTVVIVNVSRWRCDAILVTAEAAAEGVRVVELPALTEDDVDGRCVDYLHVLDNPGPGGLLVRELAITATLEWLWDAVAEPILAALPDLADVTDPPHRPVERPKLWWSPTGLLGFLPIHAAGYHEEEGRSVLDQVRSSYIPTLRALASAAVPPAVTDPNGDQAVMLVVELGETPGWPALPNAGADRAKVEQLLRADQRTVLAGPAAGRVAILTNLAHSRWLHASCHGTQQLFAPASGGLVPYDWSSEGLVTLSDLSRTLGHHEFAFLAACKTAVPGMASVNEAITVAAAMQVAGWRHVIATLWTVQDTAAHELTQKLYQALIREQVLHAEDAADALDRAVNDLRRTSRDRPSIWAPFIHLGP